MKDSDKPKTISIAEAAKKAGVGQRLIRAAIKRGQIRAIHISTRLRVLSEPFERFLEENGGPKDQT